MGMTTLLFFRRFWDVMTLYKLEREARIWVRVRWCVLFFFSHILCPEMPVQQTQKQIRLENLRIVIILVL